MKDYISSFTQELQEQQYQILYLSQMIVLDMTWSLFLCKL